MMLKLRWAGFFWLYCNVDFPILLFDVLIPYLGYIVSCFQSYPFIFPFAVASFAPEIDGVVRS